MKKEAGQILYKSIGSSRPAPGSVSAQFYSLVDSRMNEIRKSGTAPRDKVVLKSLAMDAISQEYPDMARAVDRRGEVCCGPTPDGGGLDVHYSDSITFP